MDQEIPLELKSGVNKKPKASYGAQPFKDKNFCRKFFNLMVRSRVLEEKLIKMSRTGDGFFWIGGPGEEAFNIALGLLVQKGQGIDYDFMHLHYRNNGVLMAMGEPMLPMIRQMKSSALDPYSGGRNFVSHVAKKEWNVMPVTSTIETQFVVSIGTARAQMRARKEGREAGISIVVGGDAGTAEGDFASALVWASRPGEELPLLMIVTNNRFGISTPSDQQHGEKHIADRARAFQIQSSTVDGNSPEKVWTALNNALDYVRNSGRPYMLELMVSRLYGHSSSSGANRVSSEECPIERFSKKLIKQNWLSEKEIADLYTAAWSEANEALDIARKEALPEASTVLDHTFGRGVKGGLPGRDF